MKRLCAVILMLSLVCSMIPETYAANNGHAWEIGISTIELFEELHSVTPEIAYDGTVSYINHDDYPSEGFVFAVVKMTAGKLDPSADALDISNLKLYAGENSYSQMEDDSFLENHGYTTLGKYNGSLMTDTQGAACFEVPEELLNSDCLGWKLAAGQFISEGYSPDESTEIPVEPTLTERQAKTEASILAQFEAQSDKSLENALVVVNPYETSPLTALILFDTDNAVNVSVKVYGKTNDTDIVYTIDAADTHHEIPIFGMYGGYTNRVLVETSDGEKREFTIKTAPLPEDLPEYTADVTKDSSFNNKGLMYVLGVPHRHCIDIKGDIRWYSTLDDALGTPEETNSDGTYWTVVLASPAGSAIVKVNWMGKIISSYSYTNRAAHHDLDIIDNNIMLWFNANSIMSTNLDTGECVEYFRLDNILDPNRGYIDFRNDPQDWAHPNTIEYVDGKLFISLRNQCMLVKMDYATKQIEWVATPGLTYDEQGNVTGALQDSISEYIVLPKSDDTSFEWFWSQHDISLMPDQDNNPSTDDFTLFDNGVYRGNPDTQESKMYSRLVQYRVDSKEHTITQIFEYKQEGLYSDIMSGTQALADGQFGCFGTALDRESNRKDTKLIELNGAGTVVGSWIGEDYQSYRAYYYPVETFITKDIRLSDHNRVFEYHKANSWES